MFIINEDKSIYITRGDFAVFTVRINEDDSGEIYIFRPGDIVRFKVFEKKGCDSVVLQKDFAITEESESVEIRLLGSETKIGGIIHKPKDFWYEVELNPETYPQTVIGYDEDGAKTFRLLPEGKDLAPDDEDEQQGIDVYGQVLELVTELRAHSRKAVENSTAAQAAAAAAEQAAKSAAEDAASVREDAEGGVFTPQIGANGNWIIGGEDTGIASGSASVGGVIETVSGGLSDNWILCNGDAIDADELSELYAVLPYNTDWRRVLPEHLYINKTGNVSAYAEYEDVRPLPVTGQWMMLATKGGGAAVYDANTDELITIDCPTVEGAVNSCSIFGLTHDGARYILGVYEANTSGAADDRVHLLESSDLENWTAAYSATMGSAAQDQYSVTIYKAEDLTYDGERVLVMSVKTNITSSATIYTSKVYAVGGDMAGHTELASADARRRFVLMPSGYWSWEKRSDTQEGLYIYPAGTAAGFKAANVSTHVAFFSDRYIIEVPHDGASVTRIRVADLTTQTVDGFDMNSLFGVNAYCYLNGAEYDRNTNEWVLYCQYHATNEPLKYFAVYISADADPMDRAQYRPVQIEKIPETLSYEQMKPDRSQMRFASETKRYLRDPNMKYLPEHDGETYKYIYAGGLK